MDQADQLLGFGKHRQKTFQQAAALPEFAEWALSILNPKGRLAEFVAFLQATSSTRPPATLDSLPSQCESDQPTCKKLMREPAGASPLEGSSGAEGEGEEKEGGGEQSSEEEDEPLKARIKRAREGRRLAAASEEERRGGAEEDAAGDESESGDEESEDEALDASSVGMAKRMAMAVIACGARGDPEGVLSAIGVTITRETPVEGAKPASLLRTLLAALLAALPVLIASSMIVEMRKAYRGLARLLHPDKLSRHFAGATKAFQILTRRAQPASLSAERFGITCICDERASVAVRLTRSRHRSRLWGGPQSGLQPYEYTFMMQGLKTYVCCGCLLQFGCMTAEHHCPHCSSEVWYHPRKFHQQTKCMQCRKSFGFKLYTGSKKTYALVLQTGPRIEARLRAELLERAASRQKKNDSYASRQQARKYRGDGLVRRPLEVRTEHRSVHEEALFSKAKVAKRDAAIARRSRNEMKQEEVERLAAHRFLGGGAGTAWMLTDTQLKQECAQMGLAADGTREEQLARISCHLSGNTAEAERQSSSAIAETESIPEAL
ncbi:MAG: hypothetical protein SGPRY_010858, partial [Prymnesium sp.]